MKRYWRRIVPAVLLLAAVPANATWYEARTRHFTVYSDDEEAGIRAFAARLEKFDAAMRLIRTVPDGVGEKAERANALTIFVVRNVAAVRTLCSLGGRDCGEVAGFYVPRAAGSVAYTPRRSGDGSKFDLSAQTVLLHEYTHHFLVANFAAAYPAWFQEGFAEFSGTVKFLPDGGLGLGMPALHRGYGLLSGTHLPLDRMLGDDVAKLNSTDRESLYGRGWLLTHYLNFSPKRPGQLHAYLSAINAGTPAPRAATDAFGDLKLLDRELSSYLKATTMPYRRIEASAFKPATVDIRALSPGEAAMMPVVQQSRRGVDSRSAARIVAQARTLAAPWPADARVQAALAEAEYDAGDDTRAEAAADRAIAADPKSVAGLGYKGRARLRRAVRARNTDPAVWKEARGWFVKANRAEPDAAEPLMLFYDSFAAAGLTPTANAVVGLDRAFELAPQAEGLRFRVARVALREHRLADARLLLGPIAYNPHGGTDNPAAKLIALIDAKDEPAIAALIATLDPDATDTSD